MPLKKSERSLYGKNPEETYQKLLIARRMNRISNNKTKPKDFRMLLEFQKLFTWEVLMFADRPDTLENAAMSTYNPVNDRYIRPYNPIKNWMQEENFRRSVSLWETCAQKVDGPAHISQSGKEIPAQTRLQKKLWTKFVAVQGRDGMRFPAEPTYKIVISKDLVQYLWQFDRALPEEMMDALRLLSRSLAYLAPGAKPLNVGYDTIVLVPGIPDLDTGKPGRFVKTGKVYTYEGLWATVGKEFPVKGKSLWKFLRSDSIYIEGISTTREFLGVERFNRLLKGATKLTKKAFTAVRQEFLFLAWNFGHDAGMDDGLVMGKLMDYGLRHGFDIDGTDLQIARPVKRYQFTDVKIVKKLGAWAEKYFPAKPKHHTPREELNEETAQKVDEVAGLAKAGMKIREIAEKLKLHVSTVKRRRTQAVKKGLLAPQVWTGKAAASRAEAKARKAAEKADSMAMA